MPEHTAAGRYREPSLLSLAEREDRIPAMREEATKALNALTVPAIWTPEVALRIFARKSAALSKGGSAAHMPNVG